MEQKLTMNLKLDLYRVVFAICHRRPFDCKGERGNLIRTRMQKVC